MLTQRSGTSQPSRSRRALLARLAATCVCATLATLLPAVVRADSGSREYKLKAAFIFNFIRFVDWPEQDLPASNGSIRVCVAGKDAYTAALDTINQKSVKGKTIVVSPFNGSLSGCQVLYVSAPERSRLRPVLEAARSAHVLTVGETEDFARSGGVMNFIAEGNRIRFEVNPQAADRAHLTISSQLLKLAKVVKE